uniref:Uncharacterized protein n=1 Tax=viral metagenome TaxID=1070528 RepID=A0A6C0F6A3_9ZZZZ
MRSSLFFFGHLHFFFCLYLYPFKTLPEDDDFLDPDDDFLDLDDDDLLDPADDLLDPADDDLLDPADDDPDDTDGIDILGDLLLDDLDEPELLLLIIIIYIIIIINFFTINFIHYNMHISIHLPSHIYKYMFQFCDALVFSFQELGHTCTINLNYRYQKSDLLIIMFLACPIPKQFILDIKTNNSSYIFYMTEPMNLPNSFRFYKIRLLQRIKLLKPLAIWTYSKYNIHILNSFPCIRNHHIKIHYVPPAYSPVYDYNLSSNPLMYASIATKGFYDQRFEQLAILFPSITNLSCWTHSQWKEQVDGYTIINVHKVQHNAPLELFRIAPLLSSGISVVSEKSFIDDETLYNNFIYFLNDNTPFDSNKIIPVDKELYKNTFNMTSIIQDSLASLPWKKK